MTAVSDLCNAVKAILAASELCRHATALHIAEKAMERVEQLFPLTLDTNPEHQVIHSLYLACNELIHAKTPQQNAAATQQAMAAVAAAEKFMEASK
jgi:hypothetical protein